MQYLFLKQGMTVSITELSEHAYADFDHDPEYHRPAYLEHQAEDRLRTSSSPTATGAIVFRSIRHSLVARIIAISLALVPLTLGISGLALLGCDVAAVQRSLDNHITAYADILIADIKRQNGEIVLEDQAALARIPALLADQRRRQKPL